MPAKKRKCAGSPGPPEDVVDRGGARRAEELLAHPRGEGQAARVPGEVLLELDERGPELQGGLDQRAVSPDDPRLLLAGNGEADENPGGAEGAATDHDRGAAGRADHGPRVVVAPHIAVAGDRDPHRVDDRGDDLPGREAGELLRARARVDGDRVDALALGEPRDLDRVHRAVVPAAADLDREGHADRLSQSAEDQQGGERVAHEGGALALGDDLRDGAAHVEVDRVGALGLEPPRRLRQDVRVRAQELHRDRVLLREVPREGDGVAVALDEGAGVDLLAREEARAALARDEPRSEEHTSELQSLAYLVCRLLLEKKKK